MTLVGTDKLEKFSGKHAQAKGPLRAWAAEVRLAKWKATQDIRNRYRSADFLSGNRVIFNIGGNKYRLVVLVHYTHGVVMVERVGTHAEYNRWKLE